MPGSASDPFVEAEQRLREHGTEQEWRPERIDRSVTTLRLFFTGQTDGTPYQFGSARQAVEDFFVRYCKQANLSGLPGQRELWYEAVAQQQVATAYRVVDRRRWSLSFRR